MVVNFKKVIVGVVYAPTILSLGKVIIWEVVPSLRGQDDVLEL